MYMNQMKQLVWSIVKINVYIRIMLAEKTLLEHTFLWSEVKTAIIDNLEGNGLICVHCHWVTTEMFYL